MISDELFDELFEDFESRPVKHQLSCCALCQMTAGNYTPLRDIKAFVEKTKAESKERWHYSNRDSGERAIFSIVAPGEYILEANLKEAGFREIVQFDRRNGYPGAGELKLKMYFINF